jgi:glucose-1-phosphate thymidylyltransferase
MIFYPLATLMLAGLRELLLISTPDDLAPFERLLGDGSRFGISIRYAAQAKPEGIAQAFLIASDFVAGQPVALALGDNLFYGHGLTEVLQRARRAPARRQRARLPGARPERYGVVSFDARARASRLEEKPASPAPWR